jgi:hypothetical protein
VFCRQASGRGHEKSGICIAALAALSISAAAASAQTKSGVDKLYILNCGEGHVIDISRWSPGINVGKSMDMAENCYLMHHTQGWLLQCIAALLVLRSTMKTVSAPAI